MGSGSTSKSLHGRAPLAHAQNNDIFLLIEVIKCHCFTHGAGGDAPSSTQFEVAVASCGSTFYVVMPKTIN